MFACRKVAAKAKCAFAKKMNAIEVLNQWRHIGHLPWQCFGVTWSWLYYFSLQNTNNHSAWFAFVFKGLPKHKKYNTFILPALYLLVKHVSIVLKITKRYVRRCAVDDYISIWRNFYFSVMVICSKLKFITISLLLRFIVKEYKIGRLIRQPLSFRNCLRKSFLLQFLFHASIIVFW